MKTVFALLSLVLSLNVLASGTSSMKLLLEQNEVEKLEETMSEKGYLLTTVTDNFAERGSFPRCPCNSYQLTFQKASTANGARPKKVFAVTTNGFGASLRVTISPVR